MRLSPTQIARVVVEQSAHHAPAEVVAALGVVLREAGHLRQFPLIRAAIQSRLLELGLVTIETAKPLSTAQKDELTKQVAVSSPPQTAQFRLNPGLIDGYRITSREGVVEASISNTLRNLAKHLSI